MADFHNTKMVVPRKEHQCAHCRQIIAKGETCLSSNGVFEGHFYSHYTHELCDAAWSELNYSRDMRNLCADEGAPFLCEDDHEPEDREWMVETYPAVASRLGWAAPRPAPVQESGDE
jgi:hypothetical protein